MRRYFDIMRPLGDFFITKKNSWAYNPFLGNIIFYSHVQLHVTKYWTSWLFTLWLFKYDEDCVYIIKTCWCIYYSYELGRVVGYVSSTFECDWMYVCVSTIEGINFLMSCAVARSRSYLLYSWCKQIYQKLTQGFKNT